MPYSNDTTPTTRRLFRAHASILGCLGLMACAAPSVDAEPGAGSSARVSDLGDEYDGDFIGDTTEQGSLGEQTTEGANGLGNEGENTAGGEGENWNGEQGTNWDGQDGTNGDADHGTSGDGADGANWDGEGGATAVGDQGASVDGAGGVSSNEQGTTQDGELGGDTAGAAVPTTDAALRPKDKDKDGLPDSVETNTGIFVDAKNTGTDPNKKDTDGDGFSDGEEVLGTKGGLNLLALGANPTHRDLLLEYDWFEDSFECPAPHDHRPTRAILDLVDAAFAKAPVMNPDKTRGIKVIHDYGQGGAFTGGGKVVNPTAVIKGDVTKAAFKDFKRVGFASNRSGYFHWVLMGHRYETTIDGKPSTESSGNANLPGDGLMVTLACSTDPQWIANTIVHELGHNLGLKHGGHEHTNGKPNYNSVMNYNFQFSGIDTDCDGKGNGVLDYSNGALSSLDENALLEPVGLCNNVAIDWDADGKISTVPIKANLDTNKALTMLHDHDDWRKVIGSDTLIRVVDLDESESTACPAPPTEL